MTRITMNPRLTSAKFQETLESGMKQKQDVGFVGKTKKSTRKLFFIVDLSCVPYFTDAINTDGFDAPPGNNIQTYTVSACFHDTISLSCGSGSRILVIEDFYGGPAVHGGGSIGLTGDGTFSNGQGMDMPGSPCRHVTGHCVVPSPADRDLSLVRRYCNGRETCTDLQVQRRLCNSHRTNYQQVVYTCVPVESIVDICEPVTKSATQGIIYLTTPNFPQSYPPNSHCSCKLRIQDDADEAFQTSSKIGLTAVYFRLRYSVPCRDWLDVAADGSTWRLCGSGAHGIDDSRKPPVISRQIDVTFHSDTIPPGYHVGVWLQFTKMHATSAGSLDVSCGLDMHNEVGTVDMQQDNLFSSTSSTTSITPTPSIVTPTMSVMSTTSTSSTGTTTLSAEVTDITTRATVSQTSPIKFAELFSVTSFPSTWLDDTNITTDVNVTKRQSQDAVIGQDPPSNHFQEVRKRTMRNTGIIIGSICVGAAAVMTVVLIGLITFCKRGPSKLLLSPLRREVSRDHIQQQLNSLSFYDSVPLYDTDRSSSPTTAHNGGASRLTAGGGCTSRSDTPLYDHHRHYRLHPSLYPNASFSHAPSGVRCDVPYCRHRHQHGRHQGTLRHAVSASDADYDNFRRRLYRRSTSLFRSRSHRSAKPAISVAGCQQCGFAACCEGSSADADAPSWLPSQQHGETVDCDGVAVTGPYWIRLDAATSSSSSSAVRRDAGQQVTSNRLMANSDDVIVTSTVATTASPLGASDAGLTTGYRGHIQDDIEGADASESLARSYSRQLNVDYAAAVSAKKQCGAIGCDNLPTGGGSGVTTAVRYSNGNTSSRSTVNGHGATEECEIFTHV